MGSPRRLDTRAITEGRRLEREQIARNLYKLAESGVALTQNDRQVIARMAESIWRGQMSKRPSVPETEGRSPSPWTPRLDPSEPRAE